MRIGLLFLLVPFLSPAAEIPQGSHVALRLVNSVSTRTAKEGDFVYMTTATPIAANNQIVVPVGSYVQGVVSKSVRSGRVSGKAQLGIRIDSLTLADGRVLRVSPHLAAVDSEGSSQKVSGGESNVNQGPSHGADAGMIMAPAATGAMIGSMAARTATGAGIGASAGGAVGLVTVLLTRGREVELRQGATVDVVFDRTIPVD